MTKGASKINRQYIHVMYYSYSYYLMCGTCLPLCSDHSMFPLVGEHRLRAAWKHGCVARWPLPGRFPGQVRGVGCVCVCVCGNTCCLLARRNLLSWKRIRLSLSLPLSFSTSLFLLPLNLPLSPYLFLSPTYVSLPLSLSLSLFSPLTLSPYLIYKYINKTA